MSFATIIFFTYARLDHTQRTVKELKRNIGENNHGLLVCFYRFFKQGKVKAAETIRDYFKTNAGFHSISIRYRSYNYDLVNLIKEFIKKIHV